MKLAIRLILISLGVLFVSYAIPGFTVSSFIAALIFAIILGLVNALIRPLVLVLTLPISILTLGIFSLIVNALMFWFASGLSVGVTVDSFGAAFWGALCIWLISSVINTLFKDSYEEE